MYIPKHFSETDESNLIELIRRTPLGTLVISCPDGFEANHLPFIHRSSERGLGTLCAHIPRSNPLSESLNAGASCLVIFGGPEGYISPSWYATKKEHGRVVPTWNYSVAHVHGNATVIDDPNWVLKQLNELTDQNESVREEPWAVSDAPEAFTRSLVTGLVGVEVAIKRIEGKIKASQNQPDRNQASVLEALAKEQPDSAMAQFMRNVLDRH